MFIICGNCGDSNQNDFDCCIHVCNSNDKRNHEFRKDIWKGLDENEGNWKWFIISKIKGRKRKQNNYQLWDFILSQSTWQRSTKQLTTNAGWWGYGVVVVGRESSFAFGGIANWSSHFGNQCGESSKIWISIWPNRVLLCHMPEGLDILLHRSTMFIAAVFTIAREWK